MADPAFDRARFFAELATRRLGRLLRVRERTGSTNDDAWEAALAGAAEGATFVAEDQVQGRGRLGRTWHHAPGRGLALSVLLRPRGGVATAATAPLLAGLALVRALDALAITAELDWPNDVRLGGAKLAGTLCESRRLPDGTDAIVVGVGVNVGQRAEDFPPELRTAATSLAIQGHAVGRERVAAGFLNALEPIWDEHRDRDPGAALRAWRARARFWGRPLTVRTPAGEVRGIAQELADDGALVLRSETGEDVRIVAGDVQAARTP